MVTRFAALTASAFLGLILVFPQAVAATDTTDSGFREAMVEFLTIQNAGETIEEQMTYAIAQQTLGSIAAAGIEITEPIQEIILDVARTSLASRFSNIDYLAELYTPLYAKHYSESELRELTAFWKSPLGKKTMAATLELTQGSSLVLTEASTQFIPEFQAAIDKRLAEAGIVITPPLTAE